VRRLVGRAGEPFVRGAIRQAMKIMAEQFIVGETIDDAIRRAAPREALGYRYSSDMLGEAARTGARRRALFRRLRAGDRCRGARRRRGRADRGAARDLDQALGAASALRGGAGTARVRGAPAADRVARRARGRCGYPGHARRRGVRPARAVARALLAPRAPSRARRLERAGPRGPGVPEARDPSRLARHARGDARRRLMVLVKGAHGAEVWLAQVLGLDDIRPPASRRPTSPSPARGRCRRRRFVSQLRPTTAARSRRC
jgi:hypothetical protein